MCRVSILALSVVVVLAAFQLMHTVAEDARNNIKSNVSLDYLNINTTTNLTTRQNTLPDSPLSRENEIYLTAHCRGAKLLAAMSASETKQLTILQWPYIQSP
ncbi:hypothetical protein BKA63DRAFT_568566 [Paraphoma chrysanthemicola]|jgi:hypothetical protein|nr:hypothetical protein BKA63DRAFT_568566 [Paraphoma chrysanthemicola]